MTSILVKLSSRPDTRCCLAFRNFIDFDSHTGIVTFSHELRLGRMNMDARFGVIGLCRFADVLLAVHTDTTGLALLGRVWSIVEPDELGSLSVWRLSNRLLSDSPDGREDLKLGERIFLKLLPERGNCLSMVGSDFAIGMGNGSILVFDIQSPGDAKWTIAAHGVSPVIATVMAGKYVFSVGADDGLRISSLVTGEVLAGGNLRKRFESGEAFTCICVVTDRIFIGTNKGRVFVFLFYQSEETKKIEYLHTLSMSSYPVRNVKVCGNSSTLLISFDSFINGYEICQRGNEKHMDRKFQIQSNAQVHACCPLVGNLIAAGSSDGSVAIYHESTLVYARYFSEETINVLYYHDGILWIGGDDGRIAECIIPDSLTDDIAYISDMLPVTKLEQVAPAVVQRAVAPIDMNTVRAPNLVSVAALKATALGTDSDDDDWQRGLFAN